jgi:hypothetical protein
VLDDLLGAMAIEPTATVGLERSAIAVDDYVKGRILAGPRKPDEILVGKSAKMYRRPTRNCAHGNALFKSMALL